MRFEVYEGELPTINNQLKEFMNMKVKTVKALYDKTEYRDAYDAYAALQSAVARNGMPISVRRINNQIFLIRTDM